MATSWIRSKLRRFPAIARRDEQITRLRRERRSLRQEVTALAAANTAREVELEAHAERVRDAFARGPSFQVRIHTARRLRRLGESLGAPPSSVIRNGKFHVYDLVRSLGIETPTEFGRWDEPADIQWADLPDRVVVKSAFGTHGRGVWPLRRHGEGWSTVGSTERLDEATLLSSMTTARETGIIRGPFVAEEFLDEDGSGRLPTDVKIYAFYGEVPLVVLRRPAGWGEHVSRTMNRVVDAHGHDVVGLETRSSIDPSLPVPDNLQHAVDQAKRLSLVLRTPFSRLDFYCLPGRVVFGEITPRPGGRAWHGAVVDRMLGDAWDRAEVRLARDLDDGPGNPAFGNR